MFDNNTSRRLMIKTYSDFDNFFLEFILPFVENASSHQLLKGWYFEKKNTGTVELNFKGNSDVIDNILIPELNQLHRDLWLYPLKNLSIQYQIFNPIEILESSASFLKNEKFESESQVDFMEALYFQTSKSMGGWLRTYLHHNIVERTSGVLLYYLGLIHVLEDNNEQRVQLLRNMIVNAKENFEIEEHYYNALVIFGKRLIKILNSGDNLGQEFYREWFNALRLEVSECNLDKSKNSKTYICVAYKKYLINIFDLEQTSFANIIDKIALAAIQ